MDIWDIVKVTLRRWYVVAPLLLIFLGAALSAGTVLKPEYSSTASVLLVPPAAQPATELKPGERANPWLEVGPVAMAEAVSIAVQSKASHDKVAKDGIDAAYEVGVLPRSSIVLIDLSAATPNQTRAAAARVIELIEDEVARRQAPYKPKPTLTITTQVLDPGDNVQASNTGLRRGQAMVLFVGLLVSAGLGVAVDALLRRRGSRPGAGNHRGGPTGGPRERRDLTDDSTITLPAVNVAAYDHTQRVH